MLWAKAYPLDDLHHPSIVFTNEADVHVAMTGFIRFI